MRSSYETVKMYRTDFYSQKREKSTLEFKSVLTHSEKYLFPTADENCILSVHTFSQCSGNLLSVLG